MPQFASIAAPLHRLMKKDVAFEWSPECEAAFSKLKSLLTEAPVLLVLAKENTFSLKLMLVVLVLVLC